MKALRAIFQSDDQKAIREREAGAQASADRIARLKEEEEQYRQQIEALHKEHPWPKDPRRDPGRWSRRMEFQQLEMSVAILDCLLEIRSALVKSTGDGER